MRRFLLAAMMCGAMSGAQAADLSDFPALRGSLPGGSGGTVNWQGFYIGGQAGYGASDENFNGSTSNVIAALLANTLIEAQMGVSQWNLGLGKATHRSSAYGAFTGYNWQWTDVVIGFEGNYMHGSFGGSASASQGLTSAAALSDGLYHSVNATSQAAIAISDMATLRGRAGYAFGCFLPYVFGGVALGNADITRSVRVTDSAGPTVFGPFTPFAPLSSTDAVHNHLIYGYTAGLGIDVNLIGGLFLRGEWEYIRFATTVDTSINTVRAGLGYKF